MPRSEFLTELQACNLCPRCCGVDRAAGQVGFCKAGATAEVYRYGPHHGEEPPISGQRGSGTVFFSRCTLRCHYCQNYPWSQRGAGTRYSVDRLADSLRSLAHDGCHNWNLVSPTPWLPMIYEALQRVQGDGISIPVVYNTSSFERFETLRDYRADIYLADLRYSSDETAHAASECAEYVQIARNALKQMWEMVGPLRTDSDGVAVAGVICRLLVLPGHAGETVENLEWIASTLGTDVAVSVMSQYLPAHHATTLAPWSRRVSTDEYALVTQAVEDLGFSKGWVQDLEQCAEQELVGFNMNEGDGK